MKTVAQFSALRKGAEGFAAVSFIIDVDGSVKDVSIAESSGNSDLDKAAISCATTWRYRAAKLNGQPQAVRWSFSVAWSLHGRQQPPITGPADEIAYGPAPQPGAKGSTPEDGSPHNCARLYPQDAIDAGVQGTTRLAFRRLSDGSTAEISVLRSSGNEQLDQAAIGCASQWKYAIVEGAPPFFNWTADIRWQLKSDQVTR